MTLSTLTLLCNHYPDYTRTFLSYSTETVYPSLSIPSTSQSLVTTIPLSSLWILLPRVSHTCKIMCHDWLILLGINIYRHVVAHKKIPLFLRLKHVYSIFCLFIICQWTFVLISAFFAIVNKASRSMGLQISVVDSTFIYFVNINRSGIIRSYGDSMFNF